MACKIIIKIHTWYKYFNLGRKIIDDGPGNHKRQKRSNDSLQKSIHQKRPPDKPIGRAHKTHNPNLFARSVYHQANGIERNQKSYQRQDNGHRKSRNANTHYER